MPKFNSEVTERRGKYPSKVCTVEARLGGLASSKATAQSTNEACHDNPLMKAQGEGQHNAVSELVRELLLTAPAEQAMRVRLAHQAAMKEEWAKAASYLRYAASTGRLEWHEECSILARACCSKA